MAALSAFKLDGYELYIHSGDHDPPHFHLSEKGENWVVKILFLTSTDTFLDWVPSIPKRPSKDFTPLRHQKKKELLALIATHRDDILRQWQERTPRNDKDDHKPPIEDKTSDLF